VFVRSLLSPEFIEGLLCASHDCIFVASSPSHPIFYPSLLFFSLSSTPGARFPLRRERFTSLHINSSNRWRDPPPPPSQSPHPCIFSPPPLIRFSLSTERGFLLFGHLLRLEFRFSVFIPQGSSTSFGCLKVRPPLPHLEPQGNLVDLPPLCNSN